MDNSVKTIQLFVDARLERIRMVKIMAERPNVVGKGGTIEFSCVAGIGGSKDKTRAFAKVELKAVGTRVATEGKAPEHDFSVLVECRGSYSWPYEIGLTSFESTDVRNLLCQPVYVASLLKIREVLSSIGINGLVKLPYDIRSALDELPSDTPPLVKQAAKKLVVSKKSKSPKATKI